MWTSRNKEACQSIIASYNTLLYENNTLDVKCTHTSGYMALVFVH